MKRNLFFILLVLFLGGCGSSDVPDFRDDFNRNPLALVANDGSLSMYEIDPIWGDSPSID